MSQIKSNGVTYKNFNAAINDPFTWKPRNYYENFDCNHFDRSIRYCPLCKEIMYDVNNHTLWMNAHVPHTYAATCLIKTCKYYTKH